MNQTPEELARKIEDARSRAEPPKRPPQSVDSDSAAGQGLRVAADLVAAVGVGVFLGYWIDKWLHSGPWGMIGMFFLGFGAGLRNIYLSQMGEDGTTGREEGKKDENGTQSS